MPELATIWWFFTASLVLLLVPGPSVLYVSEQTIDRGLRTGMLSTLGLACGDLVQVLAAVIGLSVLVASSPVAFEVVKYAGAAYLVWLGIRRLRTPTKPPEPSGTQGSPVPARRVFTEGLIVNALNPKSTLFFLAFLPSFVDSEHGATWSQTLLLGLIFAVVGIATNSGWALLSSIIRGRAQQSKIFQHAQRYVGGGVLLALAGVAVTTGAS